MKNNKGITLVALVVTIIILLILAGISIQMLSGNNGILTRAKEAKEQMEDAQDLEVLNMKILESSLDDGTPNINTLIPQLQEMGCTVSGESYPLSVELKGKNYQIDSEGTLKNVGSTEELTKEENYLIVMESSKSKFEGKTNVGTMEEFKNLVNSGTFDYTTAILYENIELNCSETNTWTPIGTETNKFAKVLDGRNYSINGLYANSSNIGQGLFGDNTGTIQNVTVNGTINCNADAVGGIVAGNEGIVENCVSNVTITGKDHVGGIAGYNTATGTIRNCISNKNITGTQVVGGIVGASDGNITECSNYGDIKSTSTEESTLANSDNIYGTGGITGVESWGTISNSRNLGKIEGVSNCIGGIAGTSFGANIKSCYNDGEISGDKCGVGGIVGFQKYQIASISYCYNKNKISGASNLGGIVGDIYAGNVTNCYNVGIVEDGVDWEIQNKGGICGGNSEGNNSEIGITNCYTLDNLNLNVAGAELENVVDTLSKKETEINMKSDAFVETINAGESNFKKGKGYPLLNWQK